MCIKANRSPARSRKAQGTLEYVFCIVAVLLAGVAMVTYVKRGVSGRYRNVVDATSASADAGQYEPYYYVSDYNARSTQNTDLVIRNRGERLTDSGSNFSKQGSESIFSFDH